MWLTSGSALSVTAAAFVTARHVAAELTVNRGEKKRPCNSAVEAVEARLAFLTSVALPLKQAELEMLHTVERLLASDQDTKRLAHVLFTPGVSAVLHAVLMCSI